MEQGKGVPDRSMIANEGFDAVLRLASDPSLPEGAMARLLARAAVEPQEEPRSHRVSAFSARAPAGRGVWRYAAAVPLAASLALGIYLGAQGTLDFMMPAAITGGLASSDEGQVDDLGGAGDADAYAREGLT